MPVSRRLAAILAADVAGYSRLIGADEEGTLERLRAIRTELIDPGIAAHNGRVVKTTGDGFLAEFGSTVDALRCSAALQARMWERNDGLPSERRIDFRIGINVGDIVIEDGDVLGDGVNIAARLEALAEPGGLCVSARVHEDAAGKLDLSFRDLGEQRLKNIARLVRTYAVSAAAVGGGGARVALKPNINKHVDEPSARQLSIVVLPFANLSSDPEQEYFVDGITDDLTIDLSRISGSFVIARNTAFTYKGKPVDVKQIGRELGVRYVLEGSVRRAGEHVRVNVQLIDAATGAHLWADRFDTERRNLLDAQDEITGRLARTLNLELIGADARRAEQKEASDPDARDFAMRGWSCLFRPIYVATIEEAVRCFERALEIDPESIDARLGLSFGLMRSLLDGVSGSMQHDLPRAERLTSEALERDANRSMGHVAMGMACRIKGRLQEARVAFETAVALDRNNVEAYRQLAWNFIHLGEPEVAIGNSEKALRLSPRDPGLWAEYAQLGQSYLLLHQEDRSIEFFIKARAANPRIWYIHYFLAAALGLKGEIEQAQTALAESLRRKPEINSIAQYYAVKPWYISPRERELEERTLNEGLRRIRFPEE